VRSRLTLWPGWTWGRVNRAWGIALGAQGFSLVAVGHAASGEVRVLQALLLPPPEGARAADSHHEWLVERLRVASGQEVRRNRRLVLALPMDLCQGGHLDVPAQLSDDALQAEVQLEAAQRLGVSPEEVSFDYAVQTADPPQRQSVQWLACPRSEVQAWRQHTRAAGWRLPAIEHHEQAAWRAAQALWGGRDNLLAQPHLDWQFGWPLPSDGAADGALQQALLPVRSTPAWDWLCACGAGLRALS
jgi:Tfp pilus assembly PilM family ATPase